MDATYSKMAYDDEDIAFNRLELYNYKYLQGLAKKMDLPSNVKKVELMEMIRAKRYCTEKDLEAIVNRVKMERKASAKVKRNKLKKETLWLQGIEVSSTSQFPPTTLTPVRPSEYVIQYSSESPLDIMNNNSQSSMVEAGAPFLQKFKSDRVLRSFNSMRRPNYRVLDQTDCVVGVVKSRNTIKAIRHQERIQHIREIRQELAFQSDKVTVQNQRPVVNALILKGDRQLVPVISRSINTSSNQTKRQRKVSGIYPLECQENPQYKYRPTVNIRQTDGRVCKINAIIQRPLDNTLLPKKHTFIQKKSVIRRDSTAYVNPSPRVTLQENYQLDHPTVDFTGSRAIEPKIVHEIDHSNGIDRPCYEHRNVDTQQIEPMSKCKSRQIEQPIQDYQSNSNRHCDRHNAVKLSYQGRTLDNILPGKTMERDQNRRIYKNRESDARKSWGTEIDQEPKLKRAKSKKDINNQSLNSTDGSTSQCFSHKTKEYRNQLPATNNEVVPKIMSAPMSRESRFEIRNRNMEHARNMQYARNAEHARNVGHSRDMDYTRSAETNLGSQYPNMSSLTDVLPNDDYTQHTDVQSQYSVYYHKNIKAEQARCNKVEKLPRINDVFSQFNDEAYNKLMQPLYVSEESKRVQIPMTVNVNNACLLETIYNFKSQFLTNPPLRRIAPPQTNCTFSTKTVPTAVEQYTAAGFNDHCKPYERTSGYQLYNEGFQSSSYEYAELEGQPDVGCDAVHSPAATIDTQASQDLGENDNVTIPSPEMVDDALELISQDGDYMERIGMDVRVQCILSCEWAGPKFILEYHIKKEHHQDIHQISSRTSRVQLSFSRSLGGRAWSSQLLQYEDTLYALSAQRNERSLLLAFSAIPNDLDIPRRCRITVCNKRLGQPLSYECDIKHIPDSMPYEYGQECLALDLASLDLRPNVGSPEKVEGHPELDSMELAVYLQLFD